MRKSKRGGHSENSITTKWDSSVSPSGFSGSRLLAVLTACLLIFAGCEDYGLVGEKIFDEDVELETYTIPVGEIGTVEDTGYMGNLPFMSIGHYNDQEFGEVRAVGLIRPRRTWDIGDIDTIEEGDRVRLRLNFNTEMYGDPDSETDFELYRISEGWRGNQILTGDEISYDTSQIIGGFSVGGSGSESDSVLIELHPDWIAEYNGYLQMPGSNQDSLDNIYRNEFHGLAIVPVSGDSKIVFSNMLPIGDQENNETDFARLVVDNEDPEIGRRTIPLYDWGTGLTRTSPENAQVEGLPLHNTLESYIEIDLGLTTESFRGRNIVNVELVLFQDQDGLEMSLPAGHERLSISQSRIHLIDESRVKRDFIFNRSPSFIAVRDSVDNGFRFNITSYANSVIHSTPPDGKLYLSVQSMNGLLHSTKIQSQSAPEARQPKIIVTSIKDPEE
ncbi:MAG: hypothetical protein WD355_10585 [Balneolaceae bacterium]